MFNRIKSFFYRCYRPIKKFSCEIGPLSPMARRVKAFIIRVKASKFHKKMRLQSLTCNGDEKRYPNKIASFSKALPHNDLGEVDLDAYNQYIKALKSGDPDDFERIPLGGERKLVNPQAAYAYEMAGPDSHQLVTPPPPIFSSAEAAGEMVELYWLALCRDVPFTDYDTDPLPMEAAEDLTNLSDFRGPKIDGKVTSKTLFRGDIQGALVGPYISQFLWKDVPYVSNTVAQRYQTTIPNDDHLISYPNWLAVQNGSAPPTFNEFDPIPRYIRNIRDLAEYVHRDITVEDGLTAGLILLSFGEEAWDSNNPYLNSDTQLGFSTFGAPHALDFVTRAARPGLEAAWFQKWLVHRRLRPEQFGGRIHNELIGAADYPIHPDVLNSKAVTRIFEKYDTYLLPQAYEEGCPTHPSFPAGHGTFIGAMVTMLKAFFDESYVIPSPVVASSDGLSLDPYEGPPLTVGGELNKLAMNVALGRDGAGVHYSSEGLNSLQLGEQVAIGILRDYRKTYNEQFEGFCLTKFDGTTITI